MPFVEHAQVQNNPAEHAAFAGAEEEASGDQTAVALHRAHASADDAPGHGEEGEVAAAADDLEEPVGGDVEEDVEHVEDGQGDVELVPLEAEVVFETVEFGWGGPKVSERVS